MLVAAILKDVELALGVLMAIFGFLGAWFTYKASFQTRTEQDELRRWYDAKWQTIRSSPWHSLPEVTIRWLVEARDSLANPAGFYKYVMRVFLWTAPLLLGIPLWIRKTQLSAWLTAITSRMEGRWLAVGIVVALVVFPLFEGVFWPLLLSVAAALAVASVWTFKAWLDMLLGMSIDWAPAVALLLFPMLGALFTSSLIFLWKLGKFELASNIIFGDLVGDGMEPDSGEANLLLFGLSIAASFAITLFALFVGHRFDPQASVPQNMRMLLSNVFFDGATVVVSLNVLALAITPNKFIAVPTAIFLDTLVGIVLAIGSLWVGVKQLTLVQVVRVLLAHSADGRHWEVGPYFWAMHTLFLPLLLYLLLVLVCWCGKVIVEYREFFYGKAATQELNGWSMTAALFGLGAAVVAVAAAAIEVYMRVQAV